MKKQHEASKRNLTFEKVLASTLLTYQLLQSFSDEPTYANNFPLVNSCHFDQFEDYILANQKIEIFPNDSKTVESH